MQLGHLGSQHVSPQHAIEELMRANGNAALAAERINRACGLAPDDALSPQQLQMLCSEDAPLLKKAINSSLMVSLYSMIDLAIAAAAAALPNLEPAQAVRAAVGLTSLLHQMTDDKHNTLDINMNEYVLQHIPAEVRDLMVQLQALDADAQEPTRPTNGHLIEGTYLSGPVGPSQNGDDHAQTGDG